MAVTSLAPALARVLRRLRALTNSTLAQDREPNGRRSRLKVVPLAGLERLYEEKGADATQAKARTQAAKSTLTSTSILGGFHKRSPRIAPARLIEGCDCALRVAD